MNFRVSVLSLFCISLISCGGPITDADIHGSWKGSHDGHEVSFVFRSDNTCLLRYFDDKADEYMTISGEYSLDNSKYPVPLSIRNIPQLNNSLYTIVEFCGEDSIRIAGFSPKWRLRPISFEDGRSISLTRLPEG